MAMKIERKGTIKVVWIGKSVDRIYSKMFRSIDEALKFVSGKHDFVIFKLLKQKNLEEFSWEILPYGRYKLYKKLLTYYLKYRNKIISFVEKRLF